MVCTIVMVRTIIMVRTRRLRVRAASLEEDFILEARGSFGIRASSLSFLYFHVSQACEQREVLTRLESWSLGQG